MHPHYIIVSRSEVRERLLSLPAVLRDIAHTKIFGRSSNHADDVRDFFSKNRSSPEEEGIADYGSGHYGELMNFLLHTDSASEGELYDIGCGNASLQSVASEKGVIYTGVDLDTECRSSSERVRFFELNFASSSLPDPVGKPTTFVVSNVLCYLEDLPRLIRNIDSVSQKLDNLVVIDPENSIFWETRFSDIQVHVRGFDAIRKAIVGSWDLEKLGFLCAAEIKGRGIGRISFGARFKRR